MQSVDGHVPALDGVRGLAIALVIARHLSAAPMLRTSSSPIDQAIVKVTGAGWIGVDLFFVLSGFLITGVLIAERERTAPIAAKLGRFYWRRFLRIVPLYYAACAILFFVVPFLPYFRAQPELATLQRSEPWYWVYAVNILEIVRGGDATPFNTAHFWSLSVEEQFYLVWPFVVLGLSRRRLLRVVAALLVAGPLVRLALLILLRGRSGPIAAYVFSLARVDVLGAGAMLALMHRGGESMRAQLRVLAPWGAALATAAFAAIAFARGDSGSDGLLMQTLGYSAVAVGMGSLIAATFVREGSTGMVSRAFSTAPLRTLGKYSYCLYVVHYPLMTVTDLAWVHVRIPSAFGSQIASWLGYSTVLVTASIAIAWVSWRLLESPMLALKSRFGGRFRAPCPSDRVAWVPTPERIGE
jgi:peptidoglycan/LPS O-acetylase OafA/YrhL